MKKLTQNVGIRQFGVFLAFVSAIGSGTAATAGTVKAVTLRVNGQIVSQVPCSATHVCLEVRVFGQATHIGVFTGLIREELDVTDGTYSGSAVLTTANGDDIVTEFEGQSGAADAFGIAAFSETHQVVSGTGRFLGLTGEFVIEGTVNLTNGTEVAQGTGTLNK